MKKFLAIILTLAMVVSVSTVAFAQTETETAEETGSVTQKKR